MIQPLPVLLIRINCVAELANTSAVLDIIREAFPLSPLVAISSPQSEGLEALRGEPRIDEVRILQPEGQSPVQKIFGLLKGLGHLSGVRATVVCYGSTPGLNYNRHLLSSLLFGGKKYVIGPDLKLFPVLSRQGLFTVTSAIGRSIREAVGHLSLLLRYPTKHRSRLSGEDLLHRNDRLLVVKLDSLGDVIAILPVIQAICRKIDRPVDMLVREHIAPILCSVPFIGRVYTYGQVHMASFDPATHRLIQDLRHGNYDLALELTGNSITARLFARLSGAETVAGVADLQDNLLRTGVRYLDRRIPSFESNTDYTERAVHLTHHLGLTGDLSSYLFEPTDESRRRVAEILRSHGVTTRYAVLHACPSTEYKSWRLESFAEIARYLAREHKLQIVLTGSVGDRGLNERLVAIVDLPGKIRNLAGDISLPDLPAMFGAAELVVTVDTGPAHVAGATRTPLVVIGYYAPFGRKDCLLTPDLDRARLEARFPLHSVSATAVIEQIESTMSRIKEADNAFASPATTTAGNGSIE